MASNATGADKENSEKMDGIEAHDLATLLNRFEEATSSDDINLPKAVHKAKWNIMKAKSAGNSPAVTPPATPPPVLNRPVRLKTFTRAPPVVNNLKKPIQLTVVNPLPTSPVVSGSDFTKITTTSLLPPKPKIHIQLSNANLPSNSILVTHGSGQNATKSVSLQKFSPQIITQQPLKVTRNDSSVSLANKSEMTLNVKSMPKNVELPCSVKANTSDTAISVQNSNVLRMPALDAASSLNFTSSTIKQIIPKKKVSTLPCAIDLDKKKKVSSLSNSVSSSPSSLLLNPSTSLLAAHLTSTNTPSKEVLQPFVLQSASNIPADDSTKQVYESSTESSIIAGSQKDKSLQPQQEVKLQRDEHTYCWSGPCFNNKNAQRVGLSSSSSDLSSVTNDESCPDPLDQTSLSGEVVLEGEVYVDSNGNDIFTKCDANVINSHNHENESFPHLVEHETSNRIVCFDTGDKTSRRARKYRKRDYISNSPVREDQTEFFDKIPTYYTALSIPTKPIRKTVYESVSGTLGNQDHLELNANCDVEEDEGQYNKVPAHHRIFTNTSEDVELPPTDIEPSTSETKNEIVERAKSSRVRRISSTSHHSGRSTSSHKSNRSGSRHSYGDRSSRSRSRSPASSDRSFVDTNRGRAPKRRRRNSSSNHSVSSYSSSCSSNSYCSTCGASLSRSRSRSYSSDRSRSCSADSCDSRSRSRSPRGRLRRRRTISSRSFSSPEHSSRWESNSRSRSPFRQRRNSYRTSSRSRRHQLKERSSAERKVMEIRKHREEEKVKAMEERRVLYVGKLPDNYTKHQLRKRFSCFGEIVNVRLNFRVHGDNYGFVTFAYACDAFAAKEKGNTLTGEPKFDLCFGGRRRFCPDKYADLDGNREIEEEYAPLPSKVNEELDYAALLRQHVSQQKKKKR